MRVVLVDGLVIDGAGGVIESGAVTIEDDRISDVSSRSTSTGADAEVVDLGGRTVMPGIIDTHVHMMGGDFFPGYENEPVGVAVLRSAEVMRQTLHAGITTVRTAGSRDFLDIDIRDAIATGITPGPRILASGRGITITGGHFADICIEADGSEEVRKALRTHVKRDVDSIKLMLSAGVATSGLDVLASQFTQEEVSTAVFEAHKAGKRVLTHAIGLEAIRTAISAGADSVDHGYFMDEECAKAMRERNIYLVPTFCPGYYYTEVREAEDWRIERAEAISDQHERMFTLALETGVPIAMGSDCGAPSRMPNGRNALELALMVKHGMSPEDAIVAATSHAADLLGIDDIGVIAPGKIADLLILDGNPLDDIAETETGVQAVMQGGRFVRNELHN